MYTHELIMNSEIEQKLISRATEHTDRRLFVLPIGQSIARTQAIQPFSVPPGRLVLTRLKLSFHHVLSA